MQNANFCKILRKKILLNESHVVSCIAKVKQNDNRTNPSIFVSLRVGAYFYKKVSQILLTGMEMEVRFFFFLLFIFVSCDT